jgi:hypothetical protein
MKKQLEIQAGNLRRKTPEEFWIALVEEAKTQIVL